MKKYFLIAVSVLLGSHTATIAATSKGSLLKGFYIKSALYGAQYGQVIMYRDADFKGDQVTLSAGYHPMSHFGAVGNDAVTSIRIPSGYQVTLYSDDNFQGERVTYTSDINLPTNWNDKVSSVLVSRNYNNERSNNSYNNNRYNNNNGYNNNNSYNNNNGYNNNRYNNKGYGKSNGVRLFEDDNFQGRSSTLREGNYNIDQLGIANDALSSISVPAGYIVTLYANDNFEGERSVVTGDRASLGTRWNDKVSSIRVSRNGYNSYSQNDGRGNNNGYGGYVGNQNDRVKKYNRNYNTNFRQDGVTVYNDDNFQGNSQTLNIGYFRSNRLGIGNDSMSSIYIPDGFKVTIYEDDNFRGKSRVLTGKVDDLGEEWNDKVSSMIIVRY